MSAARGVPMAQLTPERALIFRLVHIANVPWILDHGLHCRTSASLDPNYVEIGSPDLIGKRTRRTVPIPPGGTLGDYVPFYFTPCSPMLFNITTGWNRAVAQREPQELVHVVSSLRALQESGAPCVITDRHAYLQTAQFFEGLQHVDKIDWPILPAAGLQAGRARPRESGAVPGRSPGAPSRSDRRRVPYRLRQVRGSG